MYQLPIRALLFFGMVVAGGSLATVGYYHSKRQLIWFKFVAVTVPTLFADCRQRLIGIHRRLKPDKRIRFPESKVHRKHLQFNKDRNLQHRQTRWYFQM